MQPCRHILALDPGGSKCDAVLLDDRGVIQGVGRASLPGQSGRSVAVMAAAARAALGTTALTELHYISVSNPLERTELGLADTIACEIHSISEADGPFALAEAEAGIVVIAGTGARVFGRAADGRSLSLDGLGPILGDIGGGYQIGVAALRATGRALRHPRHATSLTAKVCAAADAFTARKPEPPQPPPRKRRSYDLVRHPKSDRLDATGWQLHRLIRFSLEAEDRSVIAALAGVVDDAARAGDATALGILRDAAAGLAETVRDLVDHLRLADAAIPLMGIGSVAMKSDLYWNHLCACVREFAPRIQPLRSDLPPVIGVALVGLLALGRGAPAELRATLLASAREQFARPPAL